MFRILQGIGGGGMVPVAQSILADSFPPAKRGQAFALFGVAVVVAPVIGPTLGGWLADNWSWHWCFLINVPIGLVTIALIAMVLRETEVAAKQRVEARREVGLVATFLGTLEVMLDRGLDDDWFGSPFIVKVAVACGVAFVLMIPWEMSHRHPMIDIRMIATRQFGACFLVMLATGAILLGSTASYDGIPPNKTDQASAMINAARNTGGSIGVSIVSNVLAHRERSIRAGLSKA